MKLILASQSPFRKLQMEQAGLHFEAISPLADEEALKAADLPPLELCVFLAEKKAESLQQSYPEAILVGSDQMALLDAEVLGKPGTPEKAIAQLQKLNGRTHQLVTSLVVLHKNRKFVHLERALLTMRTLTDQQIRDYVNADRPLGCAGSYKIESRGIGLFTKIQVEDHSSIIGLPMMRLIEFLLELNFPVFNGKSTRV
jgi:septum formation protein